MVWLFVDDSKEDRNAFADALSAGNIISVEALSATNIRDRLAENELEADGLLMDIDLSNESARKESGLGLTADIRAAQHRNVTPSFPIVRFSYRDKVAQNIGRDPSSHDYFDLNVEKDGLNVAAVQTMLVGATAVYAAVHQHGTSAGAFGLDEDKWSQWGNVGLEEELRVADRAYLKARLIIQAIVLPGLLVSEELLAARLGIDLALSSGWPKVCEAVSSFRYSGVGAEHFPRWWARGLEMWWETRASDAPLAATTIAERHVQLSSEFFDLVPLTMPAVSPGDRPWRHCELTMEQRGEFLPIDPSRAVRFRAHVHHSEWLDPTYAALGPASKHAEDPRLDQNDLKRLRSFLRES